MMSEKGCPKKDVRKNMPEKRCEYFRIIKQLLIIFVNNILKCNF